jgi:hypothetical protein
MKSVIGGIRNILENSKGIGIVNSFFCTKLFVKMCDIWNARPFKINYFAR